jgi:hypothetical protein
MGSLGTQPIARAQSQEPAEPQIRVCADGALTRNDLADPRCRHVEGLGQPLLADAQRLQELLIEQFPRGDGCEAFHGIHQWSLMQSSRRRATRSKDWN